MVHLAGKRFVDRHDKYSVIKVYSNQPKVTLYMDGKKVGEKTADRGNRRTFTFRVMLPARMVRLEAVAGELRDEATFRFTPNPNPKYSLSRKTAGGGNWT
jgi:beta-galactosidase